MRYRKVGVPVGLLKLRYRRWRPSTCVQMLMSPTDTSLRPVTLPTRRAGESSAPSVSSRRGPCDRTPSPNIFNRHVVRFAISGRPLRGSCRCICVARAIMIHRVPIASRPNLEDGFRGCGDGLFAFREVCAVARCTCHLLLLNACGPWRGQCHLL